MLNETYGECLVKRKERLRDKAGYVAAFVLGGLLLAAGILLAWMILMIAGAVLLAAGYYLKFHSDVEYEYIYLDKEITVDRIFAKSRRKKAAKYNMDKTEIIAPISSDRLDIYKGRNLKTEDFSERNPETAGQCYVMVYDNKLKVLLQADKEFIKAVQSGAPRNVFII